MCLPWPYNWTRAYKSWNPVPEDVYILTFLRCLFSYKNFVFFEKHLYFYAMLDKKSLCWLFNDNIYIFLPFIRCCYGDLLCVCGYHGNGFSKGLFTKMTWTDFTVCDVHRWICLVCWLSCNFKVSALASHSMCTDIMWLENPSCIVNLEEMGKVLSARVVH